jgi:CHAD domain-containing protein
MTTAHAEHETKFEGKGAFDPQTLRRLSAVAAVRDEPAEELDALYYDTADLRLLTHGVTLRRRSGGHDAGWHLKLPGAEGGGRTEVHAPLAAGAAGDVPGELLRRTAVYARGRRLRPVAHLRTHRRRHTLRDATGRSLAEVAQDTVAAQTLDAGAHGTAGRSGTVTRMTHWSEIEVELEDGEPELLRAAAGRLDAAGWHPSPDPHKLDRALADELAAVRARRPADRDRPRRGSAGEVVMDRLDQQLAALLQADPAARADEPDAVHQLRTAARRLRNLLRGQRRLLERPRTDRVARELHWFTGALAEARDHEVLAERLSGDARGLRGAERAKALRPALRKLPQRIGERERDRHDTAFHAAVGALDSPRYFALLDALDELSADPPLRRRARQPALGQLRKAAERDRRRMERRFAAAQELTGPEQEQALHGLRKAARRARHNAETALPAGGRQARRLRKRTKALQQLLGEHQDAVVARQEVDSLAADARRAGEDTFGYGLLHAAQDDAARAARARVPQAAHRACRPRLFRLS